MPDTTPSPFVPIERLEQLWFQVSGTLCNLACHHCFISCHPGNRTFGFLTLEEILPRLQESVALGTREYYFTGGEPFLNPEMTDILIAALELGPATVLTNGTVLRDTWLTRLAEAESRSRYSLEFRVSIDGFSAETNDPIRGEGTFERAIKGLEKLVQFGFLPIVTAVRTWPMEKELETLAGFVELLKSRGCARPRIKVLPTLQIGEEVNRCGGYDATDRITESMMEGFDVSTLVCNYSRIVTDRGVHVCPILIESPDSRMGSTLAESLRPFQVKHGACSTCYQFGAICSNAITSRQPNRSRDSQHDSTSLRPTDRQK